MKDNYTHITLVCDRSGSMAAVQQEAQAAVNHFIDEQKKVDGEASFFFFEFDAGSPDWYNNVYKGDLKGAREYHLVPRGMTALLDATGRAIVETGEYLAKMDEADRPSKVVFVVQTDGQENSSKEYKLEQINEMVKRQTDDYQWQFIFLGMGPDTFQQGHAMGMSNVVQAANTGIGHGHTHSVLSAYTVDYRSGRTHDMKAANYTVRADGRTFDAEGHEIDPQTGKRLDAKA